MSLAARGAESITLLACFFFAGQTHSFCDHFSFLLDSVCQIPVFSSVRL